MMWGLFLLLLLTGATASYRLGNLWGLWLWVSGVGLVIIACNGGSE